MMRTNPFADFEQFFERMSRQFDEGRTWDRNGGVRVDVAEGDDAYTVTADLPGFDKADIGLRVSGRSLVVEARREHASEDADAGADANAGVYLRRERRSESVRRSVHLPEDVDADAASATYRNGVLTVTVPKIDADDESGHRIDID